MLRKGSDLRTLLAKAYNAYERHRNSQSLALSQILFDAACELEDWSGAIVAKYMELMIYARLEQHDKALACSTWTIAQLDKLTLLNGEFAGLAKGFLARSFADWASYASQVPLLAREDYQAVFQAGEVLLTNEEMTEYRIDVLHAKSVALSRLGQYRSALLAAEDALARKRLNPGAPGCSLGHHLEIYAEILVRVNRLEDARIALDEAVSKFSRREESWADRGSLNLLELRLEAAVADYNESIFITPQPDTYVRRSVARRLL